VRFLEENGTISGLAKAPLENDWTKTPGRWCGTTGANPRNAVEAQALADATTLAGRDLSFSEKMECLKRTRQVQ